MLPCQVSLSLLEKPQEAGGRQLISTVGTGERQPTLCAHRGDVALGHTEGKMTRAGLEVQMNRFWLLSASALGIALLPLCFVAEAIVETFVSPF